MAQLTITINNSIAADVRDTLCDHWGYSGNPVDTVAKLEFVRQRMAEWIKESYRSAKAISTAETARLQSIAATLTADIT